MTDLLLALVLLVAPVPLAALARLLFEDPNVYVYEPPAFEPETRRDVRYV